MKKQILLGTFVLCLMGLSFAACARKHKTVAPVTAPAVASLPPAAAPEAVPAAERAPAQPSRLDYVKK